MSVHAAPTPIESKDHVVRFYERDDELIGPVADYLAEGLDSGAAVVVVATGGHRQALLGRLATLGVDTAAAKAAGLLVLPDAHETLAHFVVGTRPDAARFDAVVGQLIRDAVSTQRPVRAFGEMVSILWQEGNVIGALELEALWNELGRTAPFSLYCAYHVSETDRVAASLDAVCGLHGCVLSDHPT
ncbi:MAG: MEDS domain-containing protein, partial [Acidimicrobiia bacterium]|nr:MEDS domain-containing protein [Acidimicrobiia bacterium]